MLYSHKIRNTSTYTHTRAASVSNHQPTRTMAAGPGLRVLIVGASIAGPMTAYWLGKCGVDVTVIERFPSLRKGGQVVDIRHCGVTIIRKVPGLEDKLKEKAAPLQGKILLDRSASSC